MVADLTSAIGREAVWAEKKRDVEVLAFLDEECQLDHIEEGIFHSVVRACVELKLPNA